MSTGLGPLCARVPSAATDGAPVRGVRHDLVRSPRRSRNWTGRAVKRSGLSRRPERDAAIVQLRELRRLMTSVHWSPPRCIRPSSRTLPD